MKLFSLITMLVLLTACVDRAPRITAAESNALFSAGMLTESLPSLVVLPKLQLTYQASGACATLPTTPCTTVVNRAKISDLANSLGVSFGIDRIQTQQIIQVQGETGPNGEPVWKLVNDVHDAVRFVGNWGNSLSGNGARSNSSVSGEYLEISFYGTGLNILVVLDNGSAAYDYRATVDGGTEGANIWATTPSNILSGRNYSSNTILSASSGLAQGFHTVKVRNYSSSFGLAFAGYEVLNSSSSITLLPGTSYSNGAKLVKASSSTSAYNSFDVGSVGTKGGHVLVYQKSDGTIAKSVTATDGTSYTLASSVHTNEEEIRRYHWREFGAGRSTNDDFSLSLPLCSSSSTSRAFTLDDGTTTLVGSNVCMTGTGEYLRASNANDFYTFTIVGSGADMVGLSEGGPATGNVGVSIDGAAFITFSETTSLGTTNALHTVKLFSGYPYGTHTVKVRRESGSSLSFGVSQIIVYAPKTPTLPTGAVALADYYLMGNFVPNTTAGINTIGQGVLRKNASREHVYVGAGYSAVGLNAGYVGGFVCQSNTATNYFEYTFFGTGFDARAQYSTNGSQDIRVTISQNGGSYLAATTANFPTLTKGVYGGSATYDEVTLGRYNADQASQIDGAGLTLYNLPLAHYRVRFTNNTGASDYLNLEAFDVVTPIHSPKLNGPFVLQNTLSVGSQGIRDLRQFGAQVVSPMKMVAQAIGVSSGPNTTATTAPGVPLADMSTSVKTLGCPIQVSFVGTMYNTTAVNFVYLQTMVDGVAVGPAQGALSATGNYSHNIGQSIVVPVSAGYHKVDMYYWGDAASSYGKLTYRNMAVREVCN